jgi:hypothetical protein
MDVKESFYAYLKEKTLLTNLISTRLYPNRAAQGKALPYVVYALTSPEHTHHTTAASALANYTLSFTIYGKTTQECTTVKEALRNILHGRYGVTLTATGDDVVLRSCFLNGTTEVQIPPPDGSDTGGAFVTEMDFNIWVVETAPTLP